MKRLTLVLIATTFLCLGSCKKDNNTPDPTLSLSDHLTAGKWTYQLLETSLFIDGVLTEHQEDNGGSYEFNADGTGMVTYSNNDSDPLSWSVVSEQQVNININATSVIAFDVLVNEADRQEWEGTAGDGQTTVLEVVLKMTR